ncbi:hypothetical protein NDU88_004463 [Pleurodeles waltl]|uniref:Uncharacterized protein n=1 Tax=Pleurodeles waltl TaxID=8319 RepID=A0AAV7TRK8_PLEWA|nr:hypothetical protein NDU88_004463 [Pleurodeles waltl]
MMVIDEGYILEETEILNSERRRKQLRTCKLKETADGEKEKRPQKMGHRKKQKGIQKAAEGDREKVETRAKGTGYIENGRHKELTKHVRECERQRRMARPGSRSKEDIAESRRNDPPTGDTFEASSPEHDHVCSNQKNYSREGETIGSPTFQPSTAATKTEASTPPRRKQEDRSHSPAASPEQRRSSADQVPGNPYQAGWSLRRRGPSQENPLPRRTPGRHGLDHCGREGKLLRRALLPGGKLPEAGGNAHTAPATSTRHETLEQGSRNTHTASWGDPPIHKGRGHCLERRHGEQRGNGGPGHRGDHQSREATTTRSKDWILKQIKGVGTEGGLAQEERNDNGAGGAALEGEEPQAEAKKRQRNTSRSTKKGDKREAANHTEAATPGPSKRAKANNGEQISMIVQECLKSMAPLLFVKAGGAQEAKELGDTECRSDPGPGREKGRGSRAPRSDTARERSPSPDSGEGETAPVNPPARPTQVWDTDKNTRRRRSPSAGGRAPETYKRGTLGRPYMVARAPG